MSINAEQPADTGNQPAGRRGPRRITLTQWILISMAVGMVIGWLFPEPSQQLKIFSNIFLRMIKCILVPLVLSTLIVGIAGHGDSFKDVGRLALKALIYFEVVTTLALVFGLGAVNLTKPGLGVTLPTDAHAAQAVGGKKVTVQNVVEHLVPQSFFEAAATNDILQTVFFAVLFAIAMTQVKPSAKETMLKFFEALAEVMFKFTGIVMKFAPIGVGAAMAVTVGHSGLGVLVNLGKLILTLYGALAAFCLFVLLPIALLFAVPLRRFLTTIREPALLAFSTTSSEAAMPDAMQRMIRLGVPRKIVSLVMPLGYSFNLDGSTLYLAIASVFLREFTSAWASN
jgi:proton glutamate symport protein